jgi:hypothetical protein
MLAITKLLSACALDAGDIVGYVMAPMVSGMGTAFGAAVFGMKLMLRLSRRSHGFACE